MTAPFFACVMGCLISPIGRTNREALRFTHRDSHTFIRTKTKCAKECTLSLSLSLYPTHTLYTSLFSPKPPVVLWARSSSKPLSQKHWENHQKYWTQLQLSADREEDVRRKNRRNTGGEGGDKRQEREWETGDERLTAQGDKGSLRDWYNNSAF